MRQVVGMERNTHLVGQSTSFLDAVERASRAAPLDRPVLVIGERGTGKELIAERLHHLSSRWDGPLIVMNCAALPETLIEAELFGHEAGACTGATKARPGRFEEANGGTLFLDELATLSSPAQDRLLRAIEYGEVTRIGSSRPLTVDVRIVAATNEHLPRLVDEGRFRADLLDRLSFEVVTLPPLRHRQSDIPVLTEFFGRRMARDIEMDAWPGFSAEAMAKLQAYDWPGNVRELRNVLERAVILAGEGLILPSHLIAFGDSNAATIESSDPEAITLRVGTTVREGEKALILKTLEHTENNKTRAAQILEVSLKTLHNKLKEYSQQDSDE